MKFPTEPQEEFQRILNTEFGRVFSNESSYATVYVMEFQGDFLGKFSKNSC